MRRAPPPADDDPAAGGIADVSHAPEARHPLVGRPRPQLVRRRLLDDAAATHERDAVADREGLADIVRYVHDRQAEPFEELDELVCEPFAERPVERAQRLVEQEHARLWRKRACKRNALLLSTRKREDRAPLVTREPDEVEAITGTPLDLLAGIAPHAQAEPNVPPDVAMVEERVILEHEPDSATMGRNRN